MPSSILSPSTLLTVQEYLVQWSKVSEIEALFEGAGIRVAEGYTSTDSSVRRGLIKGYYASLDLTNWSHARKLLIVIEAIILEMQSYIDSVHCPEDWKWEHQQIAEELEELTAYLKHDGFGIHEHRIIYEKALTHTDYNTDLPFDEIPVGVDLFKYQFPAGLPFGISKPEFAIIAEKGLQRLHFELKPNMGILVDSVYPNFTFRDLEKVFQADKLSTDNIKRLLFNMNQTKSEKEFFREYALRFQMAQRDVPVLVPQAWMQWHSMTKRDLRSEGSTIADELYRIDFVAFWNHRRYAILIDDINHYARLNDRNWIADEESYAKRLKEDRKLRRERWQVFRVGNWEIKNHEGISEILDDLRELMNFE